MHWYLIHTKPRQEKCALENLERQGYACYLPMLPTEKLRQRILTIGEEPLFPRYLFIQLDSGALAKSWSPIRSTKCQKHRRDILRRRRPLQDRWMYIYDA